MLFLFATLFLVNSSFINISSIIIDYLQYIPMLLTPKTAIWKVGKMCLLFPSDTEPGNSPVEESVHEISVLQASCIFRLRISCIFPFSLKVLSPQSQHFHCAFR